MEKRSQGAPLVIDESVTSDSRVKIKHDATVIVFESLLGGGGGGG